MVNLHVRLPIHQVRGVWFGDLLWVRWRGNGMYRYFEGSVESWGSGKGGERR